VLDQNGKQMVDGKTGALFYRNPYFDLAPRLIGKDKLEVTIVNRLPRRQKLDMELLVQFNKDNKVFGAERVRVPGTPLGPRGGGEERRTLTLDLPPGAPRTGLFGVEQALTWDTAAIRRIDQITLGSLSSDEISHSHRTFVSGLKPWREKKLDAALVPPGGPPGAPGAPPMPPGAAPFVPAIPGGAPNPFGMGGLGQGGNKDLTINGLWTERYLEISKQGRRIPVAIALVVDQDHVDRVQTAFNNSKMRFLMTQVLLNHYPYSLKPAGNDAAKSGQPGFAFPGFPFPGACPGFAPMGPMGDGDVAAPGMMAGGGAVGGGQDTEANIELVLYGIVTLYERYPPRPDLPGDTK
jgi:hypothetical protein